MIIMSFSDLLQLLFEVLNEISSISSLICSYLLPFAFIDSKSIELKNLTPLPRNSLRYDNVVPTCEGFVFLLRHGLAYTLTASFTTNQEMIVIPQSTVDVGLVPQILQTTQSSNRVVVICFYTTRRFSTLHVILFQWRNSKWSKWTTSHQWSSKVTLRNLVHLADRNIVAFNCTSESINLISYDIDPRSDQCFFEWETDRKCFPEVDCDLPIHSFAVC